MTGASRHILGLLLIGAALALPAAQQDRKRTATAQQDLRAVTEQLERVQRQVVKDAADKDRMSRDLREAERSVTSARGSLRDLRAQRAERAATRQKLVDQRTAKEAERQRNLADLARQLRAAYFMGRNEPLKLLLNQRNTAEISRNLTYYGYFGRLRAGQIEKLNQDVAEIEDFTSKIDAEDAELVRLEQQQKARVGELDDARHQRGVALASLQKESSNRSQQLARLKKDREQLERMLKQLARATESTPFDPNSPFARAGDRLAWPVAGRIDVDFGAAMDGGRHSDGIEIRAKQGAEVRAVYEGQVLLADYVGLSGLVIILDHGGGYFSLYAHNEQLFRQVGAQVKAGELIATVGDTGGRKNPGLYFEIRSGVKGDSGGKPVNPHAWLRSREPPAE